MVAFGVPTQNTFVELETLEFGIQPHGVPQLAGWL
jgi:hypothetical protein